MLRNPGLEMLKIDMLILLINKNSKLFLNFHVFMFFSPPLSGGIGSRQQKQRLRADVFCFSRPPLIGGGWI